MNVKANFYRKVLLYLKAFRYSKNETFTPPSYIITDMSYNFYSACLR